MSPELLTYNQKMPNEVDEADEVLLEILVDPAKSTDSV